MAKKKNNNKSNKITSAKDPIAPVELAVKEIKVETVSLESVGKQIIDEIIRDSISQVNDHELKSETVPTASSSEITIENETTEVPVEMIEALKNAQDIANNITADSHLQSLASDENQMDIQSDIITTAIEIEIPNAIDHLESPKSPELESTTPMSTKFIQKSPSIATLPALRTAIDGPPVPISSVTASVRAVNPILDELLHSLTLLADNDSSLVHLDLKDCPIFQSNHGTILADALKTNTNLQSLSLQNTKLQNSNAIELAQALSSNATLRVLNLEGNCIQPSGMRELATMLSKNKGLLEVKLSNQKYATGTDAEQAFASSLQKNETLLKFALLIRDVPSRTSVDRAISRNKELERKSRFQ